MPEGREERIGKLVVWLRAGENNEVADDIEALLAESRAPGPGQGRGAQDKAPATTSNRGTVKSSQQLH